MNQHTMENILYFPQVRMYSGKMHGWKRCDDIIQEDMLMGNVCPNTRHILKRFYYQPVLVYYKQHFRLCLSFSMERINIIHRHVYSSNTCL